MIPDVAGRNSFPRAAVANRAPSPCGRLNRQLGLGIEALKGDRFNEDRS